MTRRRLLGLALVTGGALALPAPAALAVQDTTLTFGGGTVEVQDLGPASNTVRFTMRVANPNTTRLFVDTHGIGRAYIALGNPTALGVAHAVYNDVSTDACQVYTGTTFGEADEIATADGSIVFDIRKDELAPVISLAMDDSAGGGADCKGFDGVSSGRPLSFATAGQTLATPLDWVAPGEATGLRAVGTPHAITLFWTPPADALGVRYQLIETFPDGSQAIVSESVAGSAATIPNLIPGSVHTYHLFAYRFWGERLFAALPSGSATAAATEFAPPATGTPVAPAPVKQAVKGTTTKSANGRTARAFALKGFRIRATGGRVRITLPKLAKGQRIEIQRSAATKKATFARIATSKARTYLDRTVRRGRTYRYRLVLIAKDGSRTLPSKILTIRVPRR
jgi:hypothetical protein